MKKVVHNHSFSSEEIAFVQKSLLVWYGQNKRDLPWRVRHQDDRNTHAYQVWVSEIMLQQTQVATVVDYFNRFMKRFPTVQSLAEADLEAVNELWSGLGYYRRAAFLHKGARYVHDQLDGIIPDTKEGLEKLPGVGPYTAGAISSIAFGQESAIVDGNVIRVLSRLRSIGGNPSSSKNQTLYWDLASKLVKGCGDPSSLNQSLMELGSEVCQKKNPKCDICPVQKYCTAFNNSVPSVEDCDVCGDWKAEVQGVMGYPGKKPKTTKRSQLAFSCILTIQSEGVEKFVLVKRKEDGGLLSGLYEFPMLIHSDESHSVPKDSVRLEAMDEYLEKELKLDLSKLEKMSSLVGSLKHTFSHINQLVYVEHRRIKEDTELPALVKVVEGEKVKEKGVCKSTNKIYDMFRKAEAEPQKKKQKSITNYFK